MNHDMPVRLSRFIRPAFYILSLAALLVLAVRERRTFIESWKIMHHIQPWRVGAGFGFLMLSVLASTAVYRALSPRPLRYWRTVLVQTGGLGINRLLPAGSGALGVAYLYLRTYKIKRSDAVAVVSANNLIGFIGHALLLALAVFIYPGTFKHFDGISSGSFEKWLLLAVAASLAGGAVIILARRRKLKMLSAVRSLAAKPQRLAVALIFSMIITACYVAAIMLAGYSIGYKLSLPDGLIVLTFGVAAASVIPVPGGVGAAEAGIFAAMRAYGANSADALSIALLYRIMTLWLPRVVGGIVFVLIDKKGYLTGNQRAINHSSSP